MFTDVNPFTNVGTQTPNIVQSFGHEYVWHCHILGHEENDMMRAIAFEVPPETPTNLAVAAATLPQNGLNLSWTDNSASETGFQIQRSKVPDFSTFTVLKTGPSTPIDGNGQGITWGSTQTLNDPTLPVGAVYYRVQAYKPDADYWGTVAKGQGFLFSAWSNTASFGGAPFAAVSPAALAFGNVALNTPSAPQTVTLSNTGTGPFTYTTSFLGANPGDFAVTSDVCAGTVVANSTCAIGVTFTPALAGPRSASLAIATTDPANPTLTVSLTGTGGTQPLLTITANNTTMRYGSVVPPLTFSYNPGNPLGLTTPPTCTTTATSTSPVGTYPITCAGAVDANYTITYVAGTVSITPAPLTIWASNGAMTYGGVPPTITASYVGLVAGDTPAIFTPPTVPPIVAPTCIVTPVLTSTTPVGNYPSTCSGAVDPNYTISYAAGVVTVRKAALTITVAATRTYGTPNPSPFPLTGIGLVNGDTIASLGIAVTCSTTATTASPVGSYPVTCTGPASTATYNITYTAGTLTVTGAPLTITASNGTMVYGGPLPTITPSFSGFVLGETNLTALTTQPTCSTTATLTSNVGTYPSTCSGAVAPNYIITYVAGSVTVTPAALTVTAANASMVYGGPMPLLTATATGLVAPDTLTSLGVTCSTTATITSPVGTYPITCSGVTSTNYAVTYVPATLTVTPAPLTITAANATKVYGAALPPLSATAVGLVAPDTLLSLGVTCTTTATAASAVGAYPITCSGVTSTNYTVTYVPGTLTITPAALTIAANNATKAYGAPLPAFTATYTGFVNGDTAASLTGTLACITTATAASAVGTYPITCSGQTSTNYTITYTPGTLTVTAVPLTITANNATKAYGAPLPAFTATYAGFVNGDTAASLTGTLACTTTATPASAVGTYPITCSGQTSTNYTITYVPGTLTVTAVPLTLTANPATKVYGAPLPAFSVTGTGFVNGDGVPSLSGVLSCITAATPTSPVGSYPINCSGLTSPNYTITYAPGTLTVTPAALTITAPNATRVWGFASPVFTPTATGLVNPPDTLASLGVSCTSVATATSAVGSYPITCSGVTSPNYTVTYVPGTLTVTNAVQLTPASLTFAVQNLNTNSPFQTVTLRNLGGSTLTTISITFTGANAGDFFRGGAGGGTCINGGTLAAAATCTINVRFRPTAGGVRTANLSVTAAGGNSGTVALTGTGNAAVAAVSPTTTAAAPYNFGNVTRGQVGTALTVTVTNNGSTPMTFNAANGFTLGGTNPGQFRLTTGGSCVNGGTLPALGSCTITVNFAPTGGTALGVKNATVTIRSNATNGNQFVYVRGTAQ
jgi:hypothetical protein